MNNVDNIKTMQNNKILNSITLTLHNIISLYLPERGYYWFEVSLKTSEHQSQLIDSQLVQTQQIYVKYTNQINEINQSVSWETYEKEIIIDLMFQNNQEEDSQIIGQRIIKINHPQGGFQYQQLLFDDSYYICVGMSLFVVPVCFCFQFEDKDENQLRNFIKKLHYVSFLNRNKVLKGEKIGLYPQRRNMFPLDVLLAHKPVLSIGQQFKTITHNNQILIKKYRELLDENMFNHQILISEFHGQKQQIYKGRIMDEKSLLSLKEQEPTYQWRKNNLHKLKSKIKSSAFIKSSQAFNFQTDCPKFNYHECPIIFHNQIIKKSPPPTKAKNLFIFAHGFQGSPANMERLIIQFKALFIKSKFLILSSFEDITFKSINEMAESACYQIEEYLEKHPSLKEKGRIIMVGHSMGGIVLRCTLKYLPIDVLKLLYGYMSFGVPHMGYFKGVECHIETTLNLMSWINPVKSLMELSGKDTCKKQNSFIWKLATEGTLKYFDHIMLISSLSDLYVPWSSSRIQSSSNSSKWEQEMIESIIGDESNVYRADVDFVLKQKNLDSVIGRAAHIGYLSEYHLVEMLMKECFKEFYANL